MAISARLFLHCSPYFRKLGSGSPMSRSTEFQGLSPTSAPPRSSSEVGFGSGLPAPRGHAFATRPCSSHLPWEWGDGDSLSHFALDLRADRGPSGLWCGRTSALDSSPCPEIAGDHGGECISGRRSPSGTFQAARAAHLPGIHAEAGRASGYSIRCVEGKVEVFGAHPGRKIQSY
jgi:hypothetical protein